MCQSWCMMITSQCIEQFVVLISCWHQSFVWEKHFSTRESSNSNACCLCTRHFVMWHMLKARQWERPPRACKRTSIQPFDGVTFLYRKLGERGDNNVMKIKDMVAWRWKPMERNLIKLWPLFEEGFFGSKNGNQRLWFNYNCWTTL